VPAESDYQPSTDEEVHCFIHKAREKRGDYQCDECFHQFPNGPTLLQEVNALNKKTDEELIEAGLLKEGQRRPPVTLIEDIEFCPWCIRDF
jgi:hypothetical protein